MPASTSLLADLAARVQSNTIKVGDYLDAHGLPGPSFDEHGPVDLQLRSPEAASARIAAMESALELYELLAGPAMCLRPMLNGTSLQAIYRFRIPSKVPRDGQISFADLAERCGVQECDLRRILRYAMVHHHIFCEPHAGYVSHSAASRLLLEKEEYMDLLGLQYDELYKGFARTVDAIERSPSGGTTETGWCLAHDTEQAQFDYYATHPKMATRFANGMAALTVNPIPHMSIVEAYPWKSTGNTKTVVDVGGSTGFVSVAIAEKHPDLKFVVQDTPATVADVENRLAPGIRDRVQFMAHDFFQEQPVKADVYLFRNIMHNWPDGDVVRILKATIPALEPGARVVLNERVLPGKGVLPRYRERLIRHMDLIMLTFYNSREREREDWVELFRKADDRFRVKFWPPQEDMLAVIEATWHDQTPSH